MVQNINDTMTAPILCNQIYQSNSLIEARKNFDLIGMKIFLLGLQGLNPHFSTKDKIFDKRFKEFLVPSSKLLEIFGNNWYLHKIKSACKKIFDSTIEIYRPSGVIELRHIFRRLEYIPSKGLCICFDDILRPYVLDLLDARKGFTQIDSSELFKLSSPYAIRLLEVLLQYRNFEKFRIRREITRELTLSELRFMLNVPEGAYQGRLNNFKKFVLENPMREINKRTDYKISLHTIKNGRQVVGFEFKLDLHMMPNIENNRRRSPAIHDAIDALRALGFTEPTAFAIFDKCNDVHDCFARINRAQFLLAKSKRPVRNREGFLRKAIEQDWRLYGDKSKPKQPPTRFAKSSIRKKATSTGSTSNTAKNESPKRASSTKSLAEVFAPAIEELKGNPVSKELEDAFSTMSNSNVASKNKPPKRTSSAKSLAEVFEPLLEKLKKAADAPVKIDRTAIMEEDMYEEEIPPEIPNRYGINGRVMKDIKDWLNAGRDIETVEHCLEEFGLTVKQFRKEFM